MRRAARWLGACLLLVPGVAWAGPPYDTDDPAPTDFRHWEIYAFIAGEGPGAIGGESGLDLNYGAAPGVQLTATLPLGFQTGPGGRIGTGDVELGVKYRFLYREAQGLSIALFPHLVLPSGGARFGTGRVSLFVPVWAQKDWGKWSLFGGGGWTLNPGTGNRNYWRAGAALTREVSSRLTLGVEATRQGPTARDERAGATLGVGASYKLHGPFSLLAAAGPGFTDGVPRATAHAYVALLMNF